MPLSSLNAEIWLTSELIRESKRIILACHMHPDGDAIGSMLALGLGLMKSKKSVLMLCPDKIPERYQTLPGASQIKRECKETADLAISIDCGSLVQLLSLEQIFEKSKRIVEIDHHLYRSRFGDIQLIDRSVCSVGEIIKLLLEALSIPMDRKIAECLLISALVETSSFSRQDVRPETFQFCAGLMASGINFRRISDRYYWNKKISAVHLSGLALSRIKTRAKDQLVWSIVYKKDCKQFNGSQEDIDAVPDEMMMIKDVKIALLFREIDDNMLRVSLRARKNINVGLLAMTYGGGGHRDIAGCRIHNNLRNIEQFINKATRLIYTKHS